MVKSFLHFKHKKSVLQCDTVIHLKKEWLSNYVEKIKYLKINTNNLYISLDSSYFVVFENHFDYPLLLNNVW